MLPSFLFGLMAVSVPVLGLATPEIHVPYPVVDMVWKGQVERDGPNITLTGHPTELQAKIKELNPYWMREKLFEGNYTHPYNSSAALSKRGRTSYQCHQKQYGTETCQVFKDGYYYILDHYGTGYCGAYQNTCGRFSCSYDAAILMCVGPTVASTFIPCWQLAANALFLIGSCGGNDPMYACNVEGQSFFTDPTYNVLLKETGPGNGC